MKNYSIIIIGLLLLFVFAMQGLMFYRIDEKLDQRYALDKDLNLSSHQGLEAWIQDPANSNSYQDLARMRNQIQQLFNDLLSRFQKNSAADALPQIPAIDLKEEQDRYVVTADVPGADESSLKVRLNGRQLTIAIKTESENVETDGNNKYQRRERFIGEFQRSLTLPGDVKKGAMKTEYDNGVLTVILPKS